MTFSPPVHAQRAKAGVWPVSQPSDRSERQADLAAEAASRGRSVPNWSLNSLPIRAPVQRQETGGAEKTDEEKKTEALKKTGEAILETESGKALKKKVLENPTVKKVKEAATSPLGLGVGIAAVAGGVTALALTGKELPFQPPEFPLDRITPGLSGKITYTGPVNAPTFVGISITYKEQRPKTTGSKQTATEKLREENARRAAELAAFRAGLRYPPGSKEAEEQRLLQEAIARMVSRSTTQLGLPGLVVPVTGSTEEEKEQPIQRTPVSPTPSRVTGANVDLALSQPGRPLDPATRQRMESRFGHDFSSVRVHDDARSSAVAASLEAAAFTVDDHIVFGAGRFDPGSPQGTHLLAHELAHVVQQRRGESEVFHRQRTGASPTPFPAFSTNTSQFEQKVTNALTRMSTRLVTATTFAPAVLPILQRMASTGTWRDSTGREHGGSSQRFTIPGVSGRVLNLRMIFDDMADPPQHGQFSSRGRTGELVVRVRKIQNLDELTEVLYHEALHMMAWIINEHSGVAAAAGVERRAVRGLRMTFFPTQIAAVRRSLENLAQSVNSRRARGSRITSRQLDEMAGWLMEEVQVRAETEVFRLASQVDVQRGRPGPRVFIGTSAYGEIDRGMVDRYVFEFSRVFQPSDRTALTTQDRATLRDLMEMLERFFQFHVRRRFSLTAYTLSIPRTSPSLPPRPLEPPDFLQKIPQSTEGSPF